MVKKRIVAAGIVGLLAISGLVGSDDQSRNSTNPVDTSRKNATQSVSKPISPSKKIQTPTCDGKTTTANCSVEGVKYSKYIYHPAVPEKTRNETVTSYEEKVTGYCTLCNDGTYSPSCATGRGACSHHSGVAQWSAPRTSQVPVTSTKTVVETAATPEYYEKIIAD